MSASELPWVSLTELAARRRAKEPTQAPPHEPAPAPYEPLAASHDLERRDFLRLVGTSMAAKWDTRAPDSPRGVWVIESVQRNGAADPAQVGGHVAFSADAVTFQPPNQPVSIKPLDANEIARLARY